MSRLHDGWLAAVSAEVRALRLWNTELVRSYERLAAQHYATATKLEAAEERVVRWSTAECEGCVIKADECLRLEADLADAVLDRDKWERTARDLETLGFAGLDAGGKESEG